MAKLTNRPTAAIFGEPTQNQLACGHKGMLGCQITVTGKAGHSGYPETGKSANEVLFRGLIMAVDTDLGSTERYGNTTVNIGLAQGGTATNVIPELAMAGTAIRVAVEPEEKGHLAVLAKLKEVFASVDSEAFSVTCPVAYGAVFINCDVDGKFLWPRYPTLSPRGRHFGELRGRC